MRISARNQMTGTVHAIHKGTVTSMIEVSIAPGLIVSSVISNDAFDALEIEIGKELLTIFKASDVLLAVPEWLGKKDRPVDGTPLL